jgi:GT2 family glycosyltransferase
MESSPLTSDAEEEAATPKGPSSLNRAEFVVVRALQSSEELDLVASIGEVLRALQGKDPSQLITKADLAASADKDALLRAFRERLTHSTQITAGAMRLLSDADTVESAFRLVVRDKLVRDVLRAAGGFSANRAAEQAADPVAISEYHLLPPPEYPENLQSLDSMTFGEACRTHRVHFARLRDPTVQLQYGTSTKPATLSLPEYVALLGTPGSPDKVRKIAEALLRRSEHFTLVLLYAAHQVGRLKIDAEHLPVFRVACARALMSLNALDSAFKEALAIKAEVWDALPDGERRRVNALTARAGTRSGRAEEVMREYSNHYATDSTAETFRILLNIASVADNTLALGMCHSALSGAVQLTPKDWVFVGDLLRQYGHPELALGVAKSLLAGDGKEAARADAHLGLANVAQSLPNHALWAACIEAFFAGAGAPLRCTETDAWGPFVFAAIDDRVVDDHPLVTIVMTTFNASSTVASAIASIQAQTCAHWELIVVDDVSSDNTVAVVRHLAGRDSRISVIERDKNEGTYRAKNEGIKVARGEFITFHDSDDWMHPLRLERHLEAMDVATTACSTSQWIRMDATGEAVVRRGGGFRHMNPASTFFRREVFESVGLFDAVRTGADSEMVARVRAALGSSSVVALDACLAIGLHHDSSLTRTGAAAFDDFRHSPVRVSYWESWIRWHVILLADGRDVRNEGGLDMPYVVPNEILARS